MESNSFINYKSAVQHGYYNLYEGNLSGKYDNLRIYWEDQLTRYTIRPFLRSLVQKKRDQGEKVRILDLGCGSGQGYELLTKVNAKESDLGLEYNYILQEEDIECYLGVDINPDMIRKGQEIYVHNPHVQFQQHDLNQGLSGISSAEPAFDIYFSSYSSLSHLDTESLRRVLTDIYHHGNNDSIVTLDLMGRYSIEWPGYWTASTEDEKMRDYSMSYLYTDNGIHQHIDHFPIRFWTGDEIREFVNDLSAQQNLPFEVSHMGDRSILVGRHTDTGEYNPSLPPIRRFLNSLHEDYLRTDLENLLLDPEIVPEHPVAAPFLRNLIERWNILVEYTQQKLNDDMTLNDLSDWTAYSKELQFGLMTIDRVIASTNWMWVGDPRANIIEPQLSYALRGLEHGLQQGLGCGHSLLVILQIHK